MALGMLLSDREAAENLKALIANMKRSGPVFGPGPEKPAPTPAPKPIVVSHARGLARALDRDANVRVRETFHPTFMTLKITINLVTLFVVFAACIGTSIGLSARLAWVVQLAVSSSGSPLCLQTGCSGISSSSHPLRSGCSSATFLPAVSRLEYPAGASGCRVDRQSRGLCRLRLPRHDARDPQQPG